ncbi:protein kinase superfamily protein [Actinidia rufa]|uniref:cyclin-dependent kinase n=1 Tax=Actinidia rufa TaxID=165716 RepID=A0A7J0FT35_9ERIC|nr:protein kinase superfamily protein [Actinidia rufa]
MERYKVLEELGDGTCGSVYKAINMETSEISLRKLNHPNIIKLKEIVRENNELFFILDYMEYNLYQIMRGRQKPFSEEEIRAFMSQVLQGLAHMHRNGYFHRDLKPENLLVTNDVIKIADFGLAREVTSIPPFTDYVSTRWYRAPEVLLQYPAYTPAIDMWAVGAILAELFTSCPIFPGESEIDQLSKICCVLGTPAWITFPEARNISLLINISYSEIMPANLSDIIPNASLEAIDLIKQLCSWDPLKRPTADQSLLHPFFHGGTRIPRSIWDPLQLKLNSMGPAPNLELKLWDFGTQPDDCFLGLTLAVNRACPTWIFPIRYQKVQERIYYFALVFRIIHNSQFFGHCFLLIITELPHHPLPHSSIGVPQSTGFTFTSLQPNLLDRPFLPMSSPFQQSH